jgi:hypothetical protein
MTSTKTLDVLRTQITDFDSKTIRVE